MRSTTSLGIVGAPNVKITKVPTVALRVLGLFNTDIRELPKTLYQFQAPFVIDDSETRSTFGLTPTPWDDVLRATIAFYRQGLTHDESPGDHRPISW